jgi:hypothetical protein
MVNHGQPWSIMVNHGQKPWSKIESDVDDCALMALVEQAHSKDKAHKDDGDKGAVFLYIIHR